MPLSKNELEKYIKDSIPDSIITIEDLRGDGDHYSATIISKSFLERLISLGKANQYCLGLSN